MHGRPQLRQIAHYSLVQNLGPYGYHPSSLTTRLWTQDICPIHFNLVVNDFSVKYSGKDDALHLKSALEDKYKVTTDREGKLYTDIALKWDYDKGTIQISMPVYVRVPLHSLQYKKPKTPQDSA